MNDGDFVLLAIAVWAMVASVRSIRKNGLRQFGLIVGRRTMKIMRGAWGFFIVMCGGTTPSRSEIDSGPDLNDPGDIHNVAIRPESPLWYGHQEAPWKSDSAWDNTAWGSRDND